MNQAVTSTNVLLNMAISPTLWLITSNLIVLEKPIVGYKNKLKISDESMNFGLNKNVNYFGTTNNQPKKVHQDEAPPHYLHTLDKKIEKVKQEKTPVSHCKKEPIKNDDQNTELITILTISGVTTYLITINIM